MKWPNSVPAVQEQIVENPFDENNDNFSSDDLFSHIKTDFVEEVDEGSIEDHNQVVVRKSEKKLSDIKKPSLVHHHCVEAI